MNLSIGGKYTPELVIFDLDGTLIEFHHDYLYSQTLEIVSQLGHRPVDPRELEETFAAFDYFKFVDWEDREAFVEKFWGLFDWQRFPEPRVLAGACEALAKLTKRGVKAAIATARIKTREELSRELESTGLLAHVSWLATRASRQTAWTDKRGHIREICAVLKIPPEKTMMVGDNPTDITSAKEVGICMTAAVASGGLRRDVLESAAPDLLLADVTELPRALFPDNGF